jgi:hypothetical protein
MAVFWVVAACGLVEVSEVLAASMVMEAASASEMSVNFYKTIRHNNPEDSHLHTHHHENLKCLIMQVHPTHK